VELETENDAACENFRSDLFVVHLELKRRLRRNSGKEFLQMINTLKCNTRLFASIATVVFALATPALSQAPTDAQRSAIRSNCRADYQAHCAGVPPGGEASQQCLQKNMSSLSPGCQSAVRAVEPPAAPKAEAAPAAAGRRETAGLAGSSGRNGASNRKMRKP
jgi:hypothetical protein